MVRNGIALGLLCCMTAASLMTISCGQGGALRDAATESSVDAAGLPPSDYLDPLVSVARAPGSSFVEIMEVRARPDGLVFYCSGVQGLNVIDASDPSQMRLLHQLKPSAGDERFPRCQHLAYSGDLLFAANKGDEVQPVPFVVAYDLSVDPPAELDTFTAEGVSFAGLEAVGSTVYAAAHGHGLLVLQLLGDNLFERGRIETESALGVAVRGTIALVADGRGGVVAIDVGDPTAPKLRGRVDVGGAAQSLALSPDESIAWVAAGTAGLVAVDFSDPDKLVVLGAHDTPGSALQVSLADGHAFVADWNDVRVFDTSSPAAPKLVAVERIEVAGAFSRVLGIGAFGDMAFLGEWTGLFAYRFHADRRAPDLWVSAREVELGAVDPSKPDAVALILENQGTAPLAIASVAVTSPPGQGRFSTDKSSLLLAPGERGVVEILFEPDGVLEVSAELEILSDDPDGQRRRLAIKANRAGLSVGDPVQEIEARLLNGDLWRLSEQRGKVVVLSYFATF